MASLAVHQQEMLTLRPQNIPTTQSQTKGTVALEQTTKTTQQVVTKTGAKVQKTSENNVAGDHRTKQLSVAFPPGKLFPITFRYLHKSHL